VESLYAHPHQRVEAILPEERARVFAVFAKLGDNEPGVSVEYRIARPDGSVRWIHDRGFQVRDAKGNLVRLTGIASDITERKTLEMQAEQLRIEREIVVNTIGEGLQWVGLDGTIKFENPAGARMLGYEVSELIGKQSHDTLHHTRADGSAYPQSECPISKTLHDQGTRRITDEIFWRKDGRSLSVEYSCTPVFGKDGSPGGALVIFTDVTERKRTQAELRELEKRALAHQLVEEKSRLALEHERGLNRIKGQFIRMVSHEFRTPLCVINSAAFLLGSYSAKMTAEERLEQAGEIGLAVERVERMMEDFLLYEELDSGKLECKPSRVNLRMICGALISEVSNPLNLAGVIQFALDPSAREAWLDEQILRHVLCHLLDNAVKYSREKQSVTLEIKRVAGRAPSDGHFQTPLPGDYLELLVRDGGIGIPAKDLPKLYQTFHRGANVDNRPGAGMGLAIVKKLVELHQGTIRIESTEGKGTSVWVWLPIAVNEVAARPSSPGSGRLEALTAPPLESQPKSLANQ
jgi:PAS domain S-box-containing protein